MSKELEILKIEKYTIDYRCDCGARGQCMFKPPEQDAIMVMHLKCPLCDNIRRLKITRGPENINEDDLEMCWPVILDNVIKE